MWSAVYHVTFNCCVCLISLIGKERNKSQQMPTMLDYVTTECCVRFIQWHGLKLYNIFYTMIRLDLGRTNRYHLKNESKSLKAPWATWFSPRKTWFCSRTFLKFVQKEWWFYAAHCGSSCNKGRSNLQWILNLVKSFKITLILVSKRDK